MAASIAAAAITAAATIGTTVYASQQQQAAASAARQPPRQTNVALPGRAAALGRYADQLLMLNANKQAPSFNDWVSGGGKGTFDLTDPGFSPQMVQQLGFVGKHGQKVPTVSKSDALAGNLSPAQLMYLSKWLQSQGNLDPTANYNQLVDAWKAANLAGGHPGPFPAYQPRHKSTPVWDAVVGKTAHYTPINTVPGGGNKNFG